MVEGLFHKFTQKFIIGTCGLGSRNYGTGLGEASDDWGLAVLITKPPGPSGKRPSSWA